MAAPIEGLTMDQLKNFLADKPDWFPVRVAYVGDEAQARHPIISAESRVEDGKDIVVLWVLGLNN